MNYIQITMFVAKEQIELLADKLGDIGITGVVIDDPDDIEDLLNKKEAYEWDYVDSQVMEKADSRPSVTFYLEDSPEGMELMEKALAEGSYMGLGEAEIKNVSDDEWKDKWKEYFKPARISNRVVVKPSWEEYEKHPDDLVIELDPGMAFGTGTHPTTTLCVKLMEKYLKPGKDTVLDVGSGSGILSIAAALLGAEKVIGVEIDPVAVEVGKENVALNNQQRLITIQEGDLTKGLSVKADLITANLMADLVKLLSKDAAKHLKDRGIYITSGILVEKKDEVAAAVKEAGFEILEIPEEGEWCAIAARLL